MYKEKRMKININIKFLIKIKLTLKRTCTCLSGEEERTGRIVGLVCTNTVVEQERDDTECTRVKVTSYGRDSRTLSSEC